MERKILILCQERPQLSDLRREWQKDGIFARIVSGIGEVACELSRTPDGEPVAFEGVMDESGNQKTIRCSNLLFRAAFAE